MALAKGKSSLRTSQLSLHTQTMIQLLKMFIPKLELNVKEED